MRVNDKITYEFRVQCCRETGLVFEDTRSSDALRKYDQIFQLAFRTGPIWDLQDEIFSLWERGEIKGQRQSKKKDDSNILLKGKSKRPDVALKALAEDMKITPWRSMQGIRDEKFLISALSQVKAGEFSLDEMSHHFDE